jgi:hypothetical protein
VKGRQLKKSGNGNRLGWLGFSLRRNLQEGFSWLHFLDTTFLVRSRLVITLGEDANKIALAFLLSSKIGACRKILKRRQK